MILRQIRAPWLRREQSRHTSLTIGTTTMGTKRQIVRKFGKPRTPYHSNSPFFPPLSGGDPRKLIGIWLRNTKSPMPQLVISRSSTSATVVPPPPPTIIQAPMRILKRPTPTTTLSNNSSASPSPVPQTMAEREAKYQEARERIFGSPKLSDQDGQTTKIPPPGHLPNVIRNPAGPDTGVSGHDSNTSQGFGVNRGRRPPKP